MTRQFLLGTAAAFLIAGQASALTMTVVKEGRNVDASASAGGDSDSNSDFATNSVFTSEVSAHAMEVPLLQAGDADTHLGFGAWASANARQHSEIGALSISGEGSANASGSHGNIDFVSALGHAETLNQGEFEANASSSIKILFNIDEAAAFNLSGFISAGIEQAVGLGESGSRSIARVFFGNDDEETTIFEREVFEDGRKFEESGVIEAGNYLFSIFADASVFGSFFPGDLIGDSDDMLPDFGYATGSSFSANLNLQAIDKPIPEPVTASLACFGLGALVLQASRRRRA